jgi:hypothetical protein
VIDGEIPPDVLSRLREPIRGSSVLEASLPGP